MDAISMQFMRQLSVNLQSITEGLKSTQKIIDQNCDRVSWERDQAIELIKEINAGMRKIANYTHSLQMQLEWNHPEGTPECFDHYLDAFYQWGNTRNPLWLERGIFNLLAMKPNADVLELCCGDGFNAKHFYSIRSKSIECLDFVSSTIKHAQKYNAVENITYRVADIRFDMPQNRQFDNVIWDAAIEHFTEAEIDQLMKAIKQRLKQEGILSGYTIVEHDNGQKSLDQHEYEFKNKEDLARFLNPYFTYVTVFETRYPNRHNLYFWASDSVLPFREEWELQVVK